MPDQPQGPSVTVWAHRHRQSLNRCRVWCHQQSLWLPGRPQDCKRLCLGRRRRWGCRQAGRNHSCKGHRQSLCWGCPSRECRCCTEWHRRCLCQRSWTPRGTAGTWRQLYHHHRSSLRETAGRKMQPRVSLSAEGTCRQCSGQTAFIRCRPRPMLQHNRQADTPCQ